MFKRTGVPELSYVVTFWYLMLPTLRSTWSLSMPLVGAKGIVCLAFFFPNATLCFTHEARKDLPTFSWPTITSFIVLLGVSIKVVTGLGGACVPFSELRKFIAGPGPLDLHGKTWSSK